MINRIILVCLLSIFISACDEQSPLAPDLCGIFEGGSVGETSTLYCGDVSIINPIDEDKDNNDNDDGDDGNTAIITASHTTDNGHVVYKIGPGTSFQVVGGDASSVWCRPDSDCIGSGVNRTEVITSSPPSAWVVSEVC